MSGLLLLGVVWEGWGGAFGAGGGVVLQCHSYCGNLQTQMRLAKVNEKIHIFRDAIDHKHAPLIN